MNQRLTQTIPPWYRHRWPWLLMLGPFVVVVAGVITAYLAVRSNDGLVADDYYKQGLAINQVTARDQKAIALGLQAKMNFDAERSLLRVTLHRGVLTALPQALRLNIAHPTRSGLDQGLWLQADGPSSYSAGIAAPLTGRWHIALEDDRREWRLTADWVVEKQAVLELPAASDKAAAMVRLAPKAQ